MVEVRCSGDWYLVVLDNEELGMFAYMLDANCFALQMLERELASSVTLVSGLIICA